MTAFSALFAMFGAAFLAATFFPAQSEILLVAFMEGEAAPIWALVTVASLGNTLGSIVNWGIGRGVEHFKERTWFPASEQQLARAQSWYAKWGYPSLLLSWTPFIGDPLTLAAGIMREPLWRFTLIVGFAKTARYVALAAGWLSFA